MPRRVLFIDFENVQKIDFSLLPVDATVMIFYGITQRKLPEELVVKAQPLGSRLTWTKITGQGSNALDFHIAFYLGKTLAEDPAAECAILSRDAGFDPLVGHLQALGHVCRRVTVLNEAFPTPKGTDLDHFTRLVKLLKKEKVRPTKRKSLEGKIKSWFPQLTEDARLALIQRLFNESSVRESEKLLTYDL